MIIRYIFKTICLNVAERLGVEFWLILKNFLTLLLFIGP